MTDSRQNGTTTPPQSSVEQPPPAPEAKQQPAPEAKQQPSSEAKQQPAAEPKKPDPRRLPLLIGMIKQSIQADQFNKLQNLARDDSQFNEALLALDKDTIFKLIILAIRNNNLDMIKSCQNNPHFKEALKGTTKEETEWGTQLVTPLQLAIGLYSGSKEIIVHLVENCEAEINPSHKNPLATLECAAIKLFFIKSSKASLHQWILNYLLKAGVKDFQTHIDAIYKSRIRSPHLQVFVVAYFNAANEILDEDPMRAYELSNSAQPYAKGQDHQGVDIKKRIVDFIEIVVKPILVEKIKENYDEALELHEKNPEEAYVILKDSEKYAEGIVKDHFKQLMKKCVKLIQMKDAAERKRAAVEDEAKLEHFLKESETDADKNKSAKTQPKPRKKRGHKKRVQFKEQAVANPEKSEEPEDKKDDDPNYESAILKLLPEATIERIRNERKQKQQLQKRVASPPAESKRQAGFLVPLKTYRNKAHYKTFVSQSFFHFYQDIYLQWQRQNQMNPGDNKLLTYKKAKEENWDVVTKLNSLSRQIDNFEYAIALPQLMELLQYKLTIYSAQRILNQIGICFSRLNQQDLAKKIYEKLYEVYSKESPEVGCYLANFYRKTKQFDDAIKVLVQLNQQFFHPAAKLELGNCYFDLEQFDKAKTYLLELVQLEDQRKIPSHPKYKLSLLRLYIQMNDYENVKRLCNILQDNYPQNIKVVLTVA